MQYESLPWRRPTLPGSCPPSTIGAVGLRFRVRDENGRFPGAHTTRVETRNWSTDLANRKDKVHRGANWHPEGTRHVKTGRSAAGDPDKSWYSCSRRRKRDRRISTSRLNASQRLHLMPIKVVVYHRSQTKPNLWACFPLICFQRLSEPNVATQHCPW